MAEDSKFNEALRSVYNSLTDEQKAKAKACKSDEEIMQLAAAEGIELPDEILQSVSGGYVYRTEMGPRAPYRANDIYDVINDKTGAAMETGIVGQANAQARAAALGQKTLEIEWTYVNALRTEAARC